MENMEETSKKSNTGIIVVVVVLLLLGVGYMVFGKKTMNPKTSSQTQVQPVVSSVPVSTGTTGVESTATEMMVTATEFAFAPSTLTLTVGQPVTVKFTNAGKMPHDFVIDEIPGAKTAIVKSGESTSVTFTPTTAGTFKFYCSVGNHRAQGMEGTVTVQ